MVGYDSCLTTRPWINHDFAGFLTALENSRSAPRPRGLRRHVCRCARWPAGNRRWFAVSPQAGVAGRGKELQRSPFHAAHAGGEMGGARDAAAAWRREPDLPGPGVFVASAASDGRSLFVFGGMAFDGKHKHAPSNRAYRFDPASRKWERLPALPEPRVGSATPCPLLAGAGGFS